MGSRVIVLKKNKASRKIALKNQEPIWKCLATHPSFLWSPGLGSEVMLAAATVSAAQVPQGQTPAYTFSRLYA